MILIHDNKILSVEFFPHKKKLIIKTEKNTYETVEYINIIFFDVCAYSFKDIDEENIIDEATENSVLGYLNWYYSKIYTQCHSEMEYGLPLPFGDKTTAINMLTETHKYYEINACVGMDGWVIAKNWKIKQVDVLPLTTSAGFADG